MASAWNMSIAMVHRDIEREWEINVVFIIIGDSCSHWEKSWEDLEINIDFKIYNSFWSTLEQICIWSLWSTALTEDCSHLVCFIYILVFNMFRLNGNLSVWRFFVYSCKLWPFIYLFLFIHICSYLFCFVLTFANNEWSIFSVHLCR